MHHKKRFDIHFFLRISIKKREDFFFQFFQEGIQRSYVFKVLSGKFVVASYSKTVCWISLSMYVNAYWFEVMHNDRVSFSALFINYTPVLLFLLIFIRDPVD